MKTKQNKKDESKDCNLSGKDMVPSMELNQAQDGGPGGEGQERRNGIGLLKTEGCGHCLSPARIAKPPQAATWLLLAWLFMLGKHWAIWRLGYLLHRLASCFLHMWQAQVVTLWGLHWYQHARWSGQDCERLFHSQDCFISVLKQNCVVKSQLYAFGHL